MTSPNQKRGSERLLLFIDDTAANRLLIDSIFSREPGIRTMVAPDGTTGLDLARRHHPDLVLLDLELPDISGEQVLASLRADPATAATPVLILSGRAFETDRERLIAAGATDILGKPMTNAELVAMVRRHLAA